MLHAPTDAVLACECGLPDLPLLPGSEALRTRAMGSGPCLDPSANEFYAFHGQSMLAIDTIKDAGLCQEAANPSSLFGGGVYLSGSAFRANMSVPCAKCGKGSVGRDPCSCPAPAAAGAGFDEQPEQALLIARVTLGDAHVCSDTYDAQAYRGPAERPRRCPPFNPDTGHLHDRCTPKPPYPRLHTLNYGTGHLHDRSKP
ncbi:hypothetical protein T484DRAFT_2342916 [Baffinella frigidus]|nr:hypothetical protein T484DRAFT_2342916 [Cryptophyta sp. CCMP2293]